jgi:hypothetical protein
MDPHCGEFFFLDFGRRTCREYNSGSGGTELGKEKHHFGKVGFWNTRKAKTCRENLHAFGETIFREDTQGLMKENKKVLIHMRASGIRYKGPIVVVLCDDDLYRQLQIEMPVYV